MEEETIYNIIDAVLQSSTSDHACYWELSHLIEMNIDANSYDINDLRAVIQPIIEREGLLSKYDSGWQVNAKTTEIIKSGGYIEYIAYQQKKKKLQEVADEARNKTAIVQWKTIKWSFGISIAAILIAFAALIVSIISISITRTM